jgi:hypothetical protein
MVCTSYKNIEHIRRDLLKCVGSISLDVRVSIDKWKRRLQACIKVKG